MAASTAFSQDTQQCDAGSNLLMPLAAFVIWCDIEPFRKEVKRLEPIEKAMS